MSVQLCHLQEVLRIIATVLDFNREDRYGKLKLCVSCNPNSFLLNLKFTLFVTGKKLG